MKVMTFNTQHCLGYVSGKIDFELMASVIRKYDPDIVGLNEMRDEGEDPEYTNQLESLRALCGEEYKYFYFGKAIEFAGKGPYGNAIISKIPLVNTKTIIIPDPENKIYDSWYETRSIIKTTLPTGVTVMVTHFGLNPDESINAIKTVFENLEDEKCILMGDFNLVPNDKILSPIKKKMKDTADLFDAPKLSFPSDAPDRKLDYIFVSKDIEVESADIPNETASDHRPYIATLKL